MSKTDGHMIAIGGGAIADKPYLLSIRVDGARGSTIMTKDEHAVISAVLRRIEWEEVNE